MLLDGIEYAIALGHDAEADDMILIHDLVGQPPVTQPPDEYPVIAMTLDGFERSEGAVTHVLNFLDFIPASKIKIIEDTIHASGDNIPVTLRTLIHHRDEYRYYNCYSILPKAQKDFSILDYMVNGGLVASLRWRFSNLVAIPDPA